MSGHRIRSRRRFSQISLRTILIIITAASFWLGWRVVDLRRYEQAVAQIESLGGTLHNSGTVAIGERRPLWERLLLGNEVSEVPTDVSVDLAACDLESLLLATRQLPSIHVIRVVAGELSESNLDCVAQEGQFDSVNIDVTTATWDPFALAKFQLDYPNRTVTSPASGGPGTWYNPPYWDQVVAAVEQDRTNAGW